MSKQPRTWARLLSEVIAIIASILLAFAIDAWWDGQQLKREEQQALVDLASDFAESLAAIDRVVIHHGRSIDAGVRLLESTRGDEPIPSRPLLDSLLMATFIDFTTYEPESAVLNELLSSGRLALLRDDTLRTALAGWPAAVEDAVEEEQLVRRFVESALLPYLTARISTVDLYAAAHAGYGTFKLSRQQSDLAALFEEQEFESHLANRIAHERQAMDELSGLRPLIELVLERIRLNSGM